MKKLIFIFSILSIFWTLSSICKDANVSCSDQCTTCSYHVQTDYDINPIPHVIVFVPNFLSSIFFPVIHIELPNPTFSFDRPPALIS